MGLPNVFTKSNAIVCWHKELRPLGEWRKWCSLKQKSYLSKLMRTDALTCTSMHIEMHWKLALFRQNAPIDYLGIIDFLRSTVKGDSATISVEQIGAAFSDEFSIRSSSIHLTLGVTTSMTPKPPTEHERKYVTMCGTRGERLSVSWLHWVLCKHEFWAVHMHIVTITCVISVEFQCAIKLSIKWMLRL